MSKDDKQTSVEPVNSEVQTLQELYALMQAEGLDTLELKDESSHVRLVRASAFKPVPVHYAPPVRSAVSSTPAPASTTPAGSLDKRPTITTPLAGVFYRASSPTIPPFVKEGDIVDPGQTLCIVEAMKVMNEIKAEARCRILKIAVENSRPVTPGQTLFVIEPA